jgi:hypothetical protein
MESKKRGKRLSMDMDEELHKVIKARAAFRGLTIKEWLELAIKERILNEQKYE